MPLRLEFNPLTTESERSRKATLSINYYWLLHQKNTAIIAITSAIVAKFIDPIIGGNLSGGGYRQGLLPSPMDDGYSGGGTPRVALLITINKNER